LIPEDFLVLDSIGAGLFETLIEENVQVGYLGRVIHGGPTASLARFIRVFGG
jgi:hypothetical protein